MSGIKQQAISGAKWTTIATVTTSVIQLLRLSILTRFLEKSDFGVVAILTFVLGLTNTFADLGFSAAIMHKQNLNRKEFSSLYWIQLLLFIVLYIVGSCLSPFVSSFYDESSITYLLPIVLLDLVSHGIGRLYDTVLQKNMLFKTIAIRNIISAFLSLIIAFLLALLGYGVYSLILSTLFNSVFLNVWNLICGQKYYRLQITISLKDSLPLAKIGIYQTGTQILDYFAAKFDVLIIGKLLGTDALGIYNLAKELVMKVILLINSIANRVILPIFANIQGDISLLRSIYCKVVTILSRINFPISTIICVLSAQIVTIVYGSNYEEVIPLTSILCIWSIFICLGNPVGTVAIATGRTNLSLLYTAIRIIITIPIVFICSKINLTAVALGNVLLAFIMFLISWRIQLYNMIKLSFAEYIKSFRRELMLSLLVGGFMYFIAYKNILQIDNIIVQAIVYSALVFFIYLCICRIVYGKLKAYFELS